MKPLPVIHAKFLSVPPTLIDLRRKHRDLRRAGCKDEPLYALVKCDFEPEVRQIPGFVDARRFAPGGRIDGSEVGCVECWRILLDIVPTDRFVMYRALCRYCGGSNEKLESNCSYCKTPHYLDRESA